MIAACVERVTGTMHERLDSMGAENSLKQQPQPQSRRATADISISDVLAIVRSRVRLRPAAAENGGS
jgi:hypothetical protein